MLAVSGVPGLLVFMLTTRSTGSVDHVCENPAEASSKRSKLNNRNRFIRNFFSDFKNAKQHTPHSTCSQRCEITCISEPPQPSAIRTKTAQPLLRHLSLFQWCRLVER